MTDGENRYFKNSPTEDYIFLNILTDKCVKQMLKRSDQRNKKGQKRYEKSEFSAFNEKLIDWAVEFGFKIDGDYIRFVNADDLEMEELLADVEKKAAEVENVKNRNLLK